MESGCDEFDADGQVRNKNHHELWFPSRKSNLFLSFSACLCLPIERNDPRLREQAGLFLDKYLPQGIESFIFLAKNIQEQYSAEKQVREQLKFCRARPFTSSRSIVL